MPEDPISPLETLRERLYSAQPIDTAPAPTLRPEVVRPIEPTGWVPPAPPPPAPTRGWAAMPWTSRFLVMAIGFFLVAGGAAAFLFFHGSRSITSAHVDIQAQGPVSIGSGDTVAIVITVKNNNPATITGTSLVVDLPEGTREAADKTHPLDHYTDTLGDLGPGAEATRTVNAVLFGAQNQTLTIPIHVGYGAEGSNAHFTTDGQYTVTITTSPISLTVSAPQEAPSGQPFTVAVVVRSNASTPLENVGLAVTYPPGFTPTNTNPKLATGSLFSLGTFSPGTQQTVTIQGALTGQDNDQRDFRFSAGTMTSASDTEISLPYASSDALVKVAKPFLSTGLTLNGDSGDTVFAVPGQSVNGSLTWQNNLSVPVTDAQITVKFSGNGFDPSGVSTQSGFYRSNDSTILFSKDTLTSLASLLPGATGNGSFSFVPKSAAALKGIPNPTITLTVSIAGNRVSENNVPQTVSSTLTRTVKVGTSVTYTSSVLRNAGPFKNTGPVPPKANVETTYTVALSAANSVNAIAGAIASMTLPSYVRFTGAVSPSGSVTYDDTTRTVSWRIGDLAGGASSKAYFQVVLLPSASQVGTSPVLVSEQTFAATDRFTKAPVTGHGDRLTTQMPKDPSFKAGQDLVTQ